jgi:hypothetical protein
MPLIVPPRNREHHEVGTCEMTLASVPISRSYSAVYNSW